MTPPHCPRVLRCPSLKHSRSSPLNQSAPRIATLGSCCHLGNCLPCPKHKQKAYSSHFRADLWSAEPGMRMLVSVARASHRYSSRTWPRRPAVIFYCPVYPQSPPYDSRSSTAGAREVTWRYFRPEGDAKHAGQQFTYILRQLIRQSGRLPADDSLSALTPSSAPVLLPSPTCIPREGSVPKFSEWKS